MSTGRQMLVAAVVAVTVTVAFFFLLLSPKLAEIAEVQQSIEEARDEASRLQIEIDRLEDIRRQAPRTRARLAQVTDLLPSDAQLPTFIRQLQEAASLELVDLVSIAPSQPQPIEGAEGIGAITVGIVVNTFFHPLESFLARLENLDRLVEVSSIAVTPAGQSIPVPLNVTLQLRLYVVGENADLGSAG